MVLGHAENFPKAKNFNTDQPVQTAQVDTGWYVLQMHKTPSSQSMAYGSVYQT